MIKKIICLFFISWMTNLQSTPIEFEFEVESGLRFDNVSWNVAGYRSKPNIISELKWSRLQIVEGSVSIQALVSNDFRYKISIAEGNILNGHNQDSDYCLDNRKGEFSRSTAKVRGDTFDFQALFGKDFYLYNKRLKISPVIGYAYNRQFLNQYKGFIHIDEISQYYGRFQGLNSNYRANWSTLFLGADLLYKVDSKISLIGLFQYHVGTLEGKGYWNLRQDFYKDFEQNANCEAFLALIGVNYAFNDRLTMGLKSLYRNYFTDSGRCRAYVLFEDQNQIIPAIVDQRLNQVKWHSYSLLLSLKYQF